MPLDKKRSVLDAGRAALEQEALGFHNGDVAAELAQLWNFPAPIVAAMRGVPAPLGAPEFSEAAACVHLGSWVARHAIWRSPVEVAQADFPEAVAHKLGLDAQLLAQEMPPVAELSAGLEDMLA